MSTVFVFVMNVCSLPVEISICCSEFYFAVTVVGHRTWTDLISFTRIPMYYVSDLWNQEEGEPIKFVYLRTAAELHVDL